MIALLLALQATVLPWDREWAEEGWHYFAEDADRARYFMRKADLANQTNHSPEVWIRGNHRTDMKKPYRESQILYSFDCRRRTYYAISMVTYKADRTVYQSAEGYDSVHHAVPGSIGEAWLKAACPD